MLFRSSMIPKYVDKCDLILIMTVNPGFGGQEFIPETLDKVRFIRNMCDKLRLRKGGVALKEEEADDALDPYLIQVDGGINQETGRAAVAAGANVLVSGNYLYGANDMAKAVQGLKGL